ncbi:phage tail family protein [Alkalicella caledoniensis]|uniref:Phage tail family protein n=1 Tax=Alkalicella caledoniensis TaxID=2731377 RepID=A0A7G9W8A7_ALKCA|nr:phage tail domain-containing protein [Alkalicella caledoniensis]QNO14919.1 phage tail family protein [Alkalicella caledoniensis]
MRINDIEVSYFNFKYLKRFIDPARVYTYGSDWLKNSLNPIIGEKRIRYVPIATDLLFVGPAQEFETNSSELIHFIGDECTLKFNDMEFFYDAEYIEANITKSVAQKAKQLTLSFNAYSKYKEEVIEIANRVSSKTLNVPGTIKTPAIVEITPSINLAAITITGFGESFTINNLTAGNKITVDGQQCTVLQNGQNKFLDYEGWGFPKLKPGINNVSFSTSNTDITIKYKPRWK